MSAYLSNALTGGANGMPGAPHSDRSRNAPHYLPFLMGHVDEKLLARLPSNQHPHFNVLYHNPSSTVNASSTSPSLSNSSASDIHDGSYVTSPPDRFDAHRRGIKLELQDATA
jgi:hypothetical protein